MTNIRRDMDFEPGAGFPAPSSRLVVYVDDEVAVEEVVVLSVVVSEFFITRLISDLRTSSG